MSDVKAQVIRERAYQLWQEQGEPTGSHLDHWLQAEQELGEGAGGMNEGEGSRTGAIAYSNASSDYAHSGKVKGAAQEAAESHDDPTVAADLKKAEAAGKKRIKGEDPTL
jgi:hypothetical protein